MPSVRKKSTLRIIAETGEDDQWSDEEDNEMSDGSGKSVHSLPRTTTSTSEGQSRGSQPQSEDEGAFISTLCLPSRMVLAKNERQGEAVPSLAEEVYNTEEAPRTFAESEAYWRAVFPARPPFQEEMEQFWRKNKYLPAGLARIELADGKPGITFARSKFLDEQCAALEEGERAHAKRLSARNEERETRKNEHALALPSPGPAVFLSRKTTFSASLSAPAFAFSPAIGFSPTPIDPSTLTKPATFFPQRNSAVFSAPRKSAGCPPLRTPPSAAIGSDSELARFRAGPKRGKEHVSNSATTEPPPQKETSRVDVGKQSGPKDDQSAAVIESERGRLKRRSGQPQIREKKVQKRNADDVDSPPKKSVFESAYDFSRVSALITPSSDSESELARFRAGPKRRKKHADKPSTLQPLPQGDTSGHNCDKKSDPTEGLQRTSSNQFSKGHKLGDKNIPNGSLSSQDSSPDVSEMKKSAVFPSLSTSTGFSQLGIPTASSPLGTQATFSPLSTPASAARNSDRAPFGPRSKRPKTLMGSTSIPDSSSQGETSGINSETQAIYKETLKKWLAKRKFDEE